jgi:uncharacterized protein (TIGR02217 family)
MSLIDERLLELVAYGFTGGPTFATHRSILVSGHEKRNAIRSRPKYRYRAPYDQIEPKHHQAVLKAYIAALGPVHTFRFKDWADYQIEDEILAISDGSGNEQIQIIKPYTFETETVNRIITKPVDSTKYNIAGGYVEDSVALAVTADDVPIAFSVDYATGILTINAVALQTIRATCEFDVPAHFDDDSLDFTFVDYAAHSTEITIVEDFGI